MTHEADEIRREWPSLPLQFMWEHLAEDWEAAREAIDDDPTGSEYRPAVEMLVGDDAFEQPSQVLYLTQDQLEDLVKALPESAKGGVVRKLMPIADRYFRPRQQAYLQLDAEHVRRKMAELSTALREAQSILEGLAPPAIGVLHGTYGYFAIITETRKLNMLTFAEDLSRVADCADAVESNLKRNPNRPKDLLKWRALTDAALVIESECGETIKISWGKSGTDRKDAFKGDAGRCLLHFMRLLDPKASEKALVELFRSLRKGRQAGSMVPG